MTALRLYATLFVVLLSCAAMTACFAYYGAQKHRTALWLSLCMAGLLSFALGVFGLQVRGIAANAPFIPGPSLLIWSSIGDLLIVYALPRFLLSAFGKRPDRAISVMLYTLLTLAFALTGFRLASGWTNLDAIPPLVETLSSVVLFSVVCAGLVLTLIFRSSLPSTSLYRTVIAQLCALLIFLPVVILENAGVTIFAGFPGIGFLVCVATASISTILHARASFRRPKYVSGGLVSPYFAERFGLSVRELEVVTGILDGLGNAAIGEKLYISPRTVENHLYRIYQKTGIKNRVQLFNLLKSDSL